MTTQEKSFFKNILIVFSFISKKFIRYFLRGSLIFLPFLITIGVMYWLFIRIDAVVPDIIEAIFGTEQSKSFYKSVFNSETFIHGFGILVLMLIIFIIGVFGTLIINKTVFGSLEQYLYKIPFVNMIYSSTKDMIGAFVGDQKKFNHPVLVSLDSAPGVYRIGFITREVLNIHGMEDKIAVYFPDSYGFTGNLYIIDKDKIQEIDMNSGDAMKFVVSGGISGV